MTTETITEEVAIEPAVVLLIDQTGMVDRISHIAVMVGRTGILIEVVPTDIEMHTGDIREIIQ